jgi:hypothetical protein
MSLSRFVTVLCVLFGIICLIACSGGDPQATKTGSPPQAAKSDGWTKEKSEIAKGYNRGENDLEGKSDSTPQEPIIKAANAALKKHFKGKANIDGPSTVSHIIESGKGWVVVGNYRLSNDSGDFTSMVVKDDGGEFVAATLMLGDDVVMDRLDQISRPGHSEPIKAAPVKTIAETRTWTSAGGKFSIEAEFVSYANGKVKLKKVDGTLIDLEEDKLSRDDRDWIAKRRD